MISAHGHEIAKNMKMPESAMAAAKAMVVMLGNRGRLAEWEAG
jgi:hypothetical protein